MSKKIKPFSSYFLNSSSSFLSIEELSRAVRKNILVLLIPVIGVCFYYYKISTKKIIKNSLLVIYLTYSFLIFFSVFWYGRIDLQLLVNLFLANMIVYCTDYIGFFYNLELNNCSQNKLRLFLYLTVIYALCFFFIYLFIDYPLALFLTFLTLLKIIFSTILYLDRYRDVKH